MRVAKRYVAKIEKTIYAVDTLHIVAESEEDAIDMMRNGQGLPVNTEIQEEKIDNRWIDSSEPISDSEYVSFDEERLPIG
jgi:hypothetical protein